MNLDDPTLLSAHLDDEPLSPGERLAVEAALVSDPASRRLAAELAAVSGLVGGLSRPAPPRNLAPAVLARIADGGTPRGARRPLYWMATAASLVFATGLAIVAGSIGPARRVAAPEPELVRVGPPTVPATTGGDPLVVAAAPTPPEVAAPLGPLADATDVDRRRVLEMLDRPGLHRILIPVDVLSPASRSRVHEVFRESARKNPDFGRISVAQGVVIDPAFPNEAEIFTAVLDGPEFEHLVDRLTRAFPDVLDDPDFDPAVGVHLAQLDQVALDRGPGAAGLLATPDPPTLAAKADPKANRPVVFDPAAPEPSRPGGASRRRDPGRLRPGFAPTPRAEARPAPVPVPVLVWLTSSTPAKNRD